MEAHPSKTIKRARNQGRIVITLEVELPVEVMQRAPNWQRDAMSVLRALMEEYPELADPSSVREVLRYKNITVLSEKCEVAK